MNEIAREICARLDAMGIAYRALEHDAVRAIEDCAPIAAALGGCMPKNYFLTPRRRLEPHLHIVRPEARLNTSDISRQAGSARLGFGSEDALWALLRTKRGAVSPLGMLFDGGKTRLLVDEALCEERRLCFHPCDASATLCLDAADFFEGFLTGIGRGFDKVAVHER